MMKSIHERVRAQLEKAARAERLKVERAHNAEWSKLERRALRLEKRIEGLCDGFILPRNAKEAEIQFRASGDFYEELE